MATPAANSGIPSVELLAADLHDQPDYCLRPHQRTEYEEEASRLRSVAEAPDWQAGAAKIAAQQRYRQVLKVLTTQAPRAIEETARRDRVAKGADTVLNDVIRPSMLSRAEMRRNPAGAVGEFMRRENSPEIQRAIRTWQRAKYALEPHTPHDDHALVEKHRPDVPLGMSPYGVSTFMGDAQMPGHIAYSHIPPQQWPFPPPQTTAVAQVQQREKRKASPATLAALARGRATRAANQAAAKGPVG